MIIKHIKDESNVKDIDKFIKDGKDVFILVYMVGCGPCNATRPEWAKLESALKEQYANKDNVAVIDVDQELIPHINIINSTKWSKFKSKIIQWNLEHLDIDIILDRINKVGSVDKLTQIEKQFLDNYK